MAAVGRLARTLGAEVEQSVPIIAKLREEEAAAVADLRIVHAELMAVVTQRQRLGEVVGERLEAAEMRFPPLRVEFEPNMLGRAWLRKRGIALGNRAGSTGS